MAIDDEKTVDEFLAETLGLAQAELLRRFGTDVNVRAKPDTSLVTDADLASEAIIIARIKRYFPQDKIYSEEAGLSSTERTPGSHIWIIDPLDGTTNFANNYPFFCVSIGRGRFNANGRIEMTAGGIVDPSRNKTYTAICGAGATCNGSPMRVASARPLGQAFLVTGFYYHKGEALQREIARFSKIAAHCQSIRRDGAAALDLALVAEGVYDGFWELGLSPWDLAAGSLLVQEAGGVVRNYASAKTSAFDIEAEGIVAGASSIAEALYSYT